MNGSVIATTSYGAVSTPSTIAEGLAAQASSSLAYVSAVDDTLYITAVTPGSASNSISYSIQNAGYNTGYFTYPSFPDSTISGNLEGGANAQNSGQPTTVYSYCVSGPSNTCTPSNNGYDPAGNLLGYTDINGNASGNTSIMGAWNFQYDTLNRLVAAQNTATTPASGQFANSAQYAGDYGCWSYDPFGNRLSQSMSTTPCTGTPPLTSWANYNANNQFTTTSQARSGVPYDASGNVLNDGVNQYLYDGEGRICAVASTPLPSMTAMTGYIYDADGTRVAKGSITAWSCDPGSNGFQTTNDYVLGPGGEQVTEMGMGGASDGSTTSGLPWQHTNVWAGGKLLATFDNDGLHFYFDDPLGTRRAQTDYAGVLEQNCQSLPYGDSLNCTGSTITPTEHHFTGKERDTESGNDYFGARYYSSAMGRWMSPDRPFADQHLDNPQSWNLYLYARNNPLALFDPDGEQAASVTASVPLGTATTTSWHPVETVDMGSFLATAFPAAIAREGVNQDQPTHIYAYQGNGAGDDTGGCVLGCSTVWARNDTGFNVGVSFTYDADHNAQSASLSFSVNDSAHFLVGSTLTVTSGPVPGTGGLPPSPTSTAQIDSNALHGLSADELAKLAVAASRLPDGGLKSALTTSIDKEKSTRDKSDKKDNEQSPTPPSTGDCSAQFSHC